MILHDNQIRLTQIHLYEIRKTVEAKKNCYCCSERINGGSRIDDIFHLFGNPSENCRIPGSNWMSSFNDYRKQNMYWNWIDFLLRILEAVSEILEINGRFLSKWLENHRFHISIEDYFIFGCFPPDLNIWRSVI